MEGVTKRCLVAICGPILNIRKYLFYGRSSVYTYITVWSTPPYIVPSGARLDGFSVILSFWPNNNWNSEKRHFKNPLWWQHFDRRVQMALWIIFLFQCTSDCKVANKMGRKKSTNCHTTKTIDGPLGLVLRQ